MSITTNPFGTHTENGVYMMGDGHDIKEGDTFTAGQSNSFGHESAFHCYRVLKTNRKPMHATGIKPPRNQTIDAL